MDIALIENGNGGDVKLVGNDLAKQQGWGNMVYIALFGGNPGHPTKERVPAQQDFSWWGNNLLFPQDQSVQFNSLTEKKLQDVALTSSGRIEIENAVKEDLKFMSDFATITASVLITGVDRIEIRILVQELDTLQGSSPDQYRAFVFIWDATRRQLGDFFFGDFNDDFFVG